ncbi:hypothetical protein OHA98_14985 [Streptomyces sp. NBC_00654]|uniref:hypothetical protein n=1 Tax=Streptomyces sp. NBC_00654 TaxID=2975799 RepID=UPI00224DD20D|nr:hypothetical protein [Streptomyces sp. NBC_00654]MCX4966121.1 hypothetical protein [Streptomyces sp. NBC_00654]
MSLPYEPPDDARGTLPRRAGGFRAGRAARSAVTAVLITLACLLVPVSLLTVWVHGIVLDSDRYVSMVSPLATDPAIEEAAVRRITAAADVRVDGARVTADLGAWLEAQGLPPRVATAVEALGPQLDEAVDRAVAKVATRFVRSDRFEAIWTGANRAAHSSVVHALTGEGRGAVEVEGGTVTLDIGAAVERVKQDLVHAGLSPAERIPEVDKRMVLFQSDELEKTRNAVRLLDAVGNWLPVLTVILGAGGVLLARRRRRALVTTALCAAAACLVLAVALAVARRYYLDHLPAQVQSREAAAAVFDTLVRFLKDSVGTALVLAVVVALGAYLSGTGRLPRGVRGTVERAADSVAGLCAAHDIRTGRAGTWVLAHRREVTLGVLAVIALVFALWNRPTVLTVLSFTLILLAVLALITLLAAGGRVEARREPVGGP